MFPAANVSGAVAKPAQSAQPLTAQKTSQPQAPETARTSSGESAAANIKAETTVAIQAPEQSSVVARLRDQETAENTDRKFPPVDRPTGPPPTFEETPLERQARVALNPPDVEFEPETPPETPAPDQNVAREPEIEPKIQVAASSEQPDPPPTRSEKAEASFTETRTISEPKEPASVDVAR